MQSDHHSADFVFGGQKTRSAALPTTAADELKGFVERLSFAIGPLGAGFVLDVLDLATFGPIGLFFGAIVGGYAGWILSNYEGIDRNLRIAFAVCAAAYMTIPFTEAVPAATILVLLARFFAGPRAEPESKTESPPPYDSGAGTSKTQGFSKK